MLYLMGPDGLVNLSSIRRGSQADNFLPFFLTCVNDYN